MRQCHKGGAESAADSFDLGTKYPVANQAGDMGHPYGHGLQEVSPNCRVLFPWKHGGSQDQYLVNSWVLGLSLSPGVGPRAHGGAELWLLVPGLALWWQRGESGPLLSPPAPIVFGGVEITQFPLSHYGCCCEA